MAVVSPLELTYVDKQARIAQIRLSL